MTTFLAFFPSGSEWFIICLVVLIFFGPKKLPEVARMLGRVRGEYQKARQKIETEINQMTREVDSVKVQVAQHIQPRLDLLDEIKASEQKAANHEKS